MSWVLTSRNLQKRRLLRVSVALALLIVMMSQGYALGVHLRNLLGFQIAGQVLSPIAGPIAHDLNFNQVNSFAGQTFIGNVCARNGSTLAQSTQPRVPVFRHNAAESWTKYQQ